MEMYSFDTLDKLNLQIPFSYMLYAYSVKQPIGELTKLHKMDSYKRLHTVNIQTKRLIVTHLNLDTK